MCLSAWAEYLRKNNRLYCILPLSALASQQRAPVFCLCICFFLQIWHKHPLILSNDLISAWCLVVMIMLPNSVMDFNGVTIVLFYGDTFSFFSQSYVYLNKRKTWWTHCQSSCILNPPSPSFEERHFTPLVWSVKIINGCVKDWAKWLQKYRLQKNDNE